MRARVLAIIAAVVLVAGAVLIRSAITGKDEDACPDGVEDCGDGGGGSGRPRVACTPDLDDVCDALAAEEVIEKVEPVDLDRAVARAEDLDGWLTYGAAPTIVGYDVSNDPRQGPYDLPPTPIASARLTAVVPPASTDAVGPRCMGTPTWVCLDAAVQTGDVPLAVGRPSSAQALTNLAPLAEAGRYGDPDVDPVSALERDTQSYRDALSPQRSPAGDVAEQLDQLAATNGLDAMAVAPDRLAQRAVRQSSDRQTDLRALSVAPAASAVVVLARTRAGDLSNDVEEALLVDGAPADALAARGYRIDPDADVPTTGEAGFLYQVWKVLEA